jgi:hypothetical protein
MSQLCPLCGKNKIEEALFCEECTKKIHSDYEVALPEKQNGEVSPPEEGSIIQHESPFIDSVEDEKVPDAERKFTEPVVEKQDLQEQTELSEPIEEEPFTYEETEKTAPLEVSEPVVPSYLPKKPKKGRVFLWIVIIVLLLIAAFFVYNETIRKGNLERSGWETAVRENSEEGFLGYMEAFPGGAHVEEAEAALLNLKSDEASVWERMKMTDKVTELRDFMQRHPASNYAPLVKRRLDSLSWMGALHANTAASYSDYMMMVQSGEFSGDYLFRAEERYEMLFQSYPVDVATLDSIRATVNGFYSSLSAVDHSGISRWLASTVHRFFDSGTATRERILGELLVAGAQTQGATLKFMPDLQSVQYDKTFNDNYKVNVPLLKTYLKEGILEQVTGYIVHLELNPLFQIVSIYETKPYSGAP